MGKIFWCSHASSKVYIARPKPFPSISTKAEEICISDRILRACMFTCKNPIKRYPIPYAKTIYFGVEHASEYPFKEVKVRNLWIFSFFFTFLPFLSDLYESSRFPCAFFLMRTFFSFLCIHYAAPTLNGIQIIANFAHNVSGTSFQIAVQLAYKNYL